MLATKKPLTTDALAKIKTKGVQYADFAKLVSHRIKEQGWKTNAPRHAVTASKMEAIMTWDIPTLDASVPKGYVLTVGVRICNSQRHAPTVYVGITHVATGRGLVYKEFKSFTTPPATISDEDLAGEVVECVNICKGKLVKWASWLRKQTITEGQAAQLMLAGCRNTRHNSMILWKRLFLVDAAWRSTSHQKKYKSTAWGLLQAMAEVTGQSPPIDQAGQLFRFQRLLRQELASPVKV